MLFFLNVVIYIGDEKTFKTIANIQKLLLFIRWELGTSKSMVGTKLRRIHVCLHSQAGNRL